MLGREWDARGRGGLVRRDALAVIGGAGASLAAGPGGWAAPVDALAADVAAYDALGEHRTASPGDTATTAWLSRRLGGAGLATQRQPLQIPLFVPRTCRVLAGGEITPAFPAWPVKPTSPEGVTAVLAPAEAADLAGKIALVRLAQEPGGTWAARGVGDVVLHAAGRGPRAIVVATEGPTGEIVALNTDLARFAWPVPVVLAPGRAAARLSELAAGGAVAKVIAAGDLTPSATADNVIGRRPGPGPALVVSTPKTGWFHCAGERATGIAVFLDLARRLVRDTDADLTFVAFAGHELDYLGARQFRSIAPPPAKVRGWLHIGANAAMQPLAVKGGVVSPTAATFPDRRATAAPAVLAAAAAAFTGAARYGPAATLVDANAAGELSVFHPDYPTLAGIIGASPLFHTPRDRADLATTPADLHAVAKASLGFLNALLASQPAAA